MNIKTLNTQEIYRGKVFTVRRDQIEMPSGKVAHLDIIQHNGAVVILPIDQDDQIWFIHQYRHAAGEIILELPAGTLEDNESAESSAHREIREEIGMAAGQLIQLGEFYIAPGYSTEYLYIYLAKDLYPSPLPMDEDELITIEKISIPKAYQMARQGEIRDAKTLAALLLAQPHLVKA